ncbi:MAG: acyltransferase [Butyrivibrio sp.]|nr:acyltransferase [Butyrivibrio sp.]
MRKDDPFYILCAAQAVPVFIMLSGYNYAGGVKDPSFKSLYAPRKLLKRFLRYTIPIIITYLVILAGLTAIGNDYSGGGWLRLFIWGDYGPGGYYYGIMLQFLLVFPMIYRVVCSYDFEGVLVIGVCNLFFELFFQSHAIDVAIYRVLIFKYILFIACGVYLYIHKAEKIKGIYLLIMLLTGAGYLLMPGYWNYEYRVFKYWSPTSMVVIAWIFPILYFLITNYHSKAVCNLAGRLIGKIGKASYHIMCTQMLWFNFRGVLIYRHYDLSKLGAIIETGCGILFSVLSGFFFYKMQYILQHMKQRHPDS